MHKIGGRWLVGWLALVYCVYQFVNIGIFVVNTLSSGSKKRVHVNFVYATALLCLYSTQNKFFMENKTKRGRIGKKAM